MPAAGICGRPDGAIVEITLGTGLDGLPLGGRCVQVYPEQRLKLFNPTDAVIHVVFGRFDVQIPPGGGTLLDEPAGSYLARGVHYLHHGPAIMLVEAVPTP